MNFGIQSTVKNVNTYSDSFSTNRVVASRVNEIVGRLRERGHRLTPQRYAVVRALVEGGISGRCVLPRQCLLGLGRSGKRVGLHYSAVGNTIAQVRDRPDAIASEVVARVGENT